MNYLDAHEAYYPPLEYRDRFSGVRSELGLHGLDMNVQNAVMRGDRSLTSEEFEHLNALYDGELAYLDDQLTRLLSGLARHPKWSEMLVVITADHGEALGEHDTIGHDAGLYEETIRIPLIFKGPDGRGAVPNGEELAGPVESVDVFATILEHANIVQPADTDGRPWGRGRTYARSWRYWSEPRGISNPKFGIEHRAVISDGWKLIVTSAGGIALYDLDADPKERHNLTEANPDQYRRLASMLDRNEQREAGQRPPEDPEAMERLRALGYIQ